MALSESLPELPPDFGDKMETIQKHQKDVAAAKSEEDLFSAKLRYDKTVEDLVIMAQGGKAKGMRNKFYPGWCDEHFVSLLDEIGEGSRLG